MSLAFRLRNSAWFLLVALVGISAIATVTVFPGIAVGQEDDFGPYSLKVLEKPVTDENKDDILGDGSGSVKFDPDTRTLTLNNADISGDNIATAVVSSDVLNVQVSGENTIHASGAKTDKNKEADRIGIAAKGLVFSGDGSVNITTAEVDFLKKAFAISADTGGIEFAGPTVNATSGYARDGDVRSVFSTGPISVTDGILRADTRSSTMTSVGIETNDKFTVSGGTVEAIAGQATVVGNRDYMSRESIGISATSGIEIAGGDVTTAGHTRAVVTRQGSVDIANELPVLVSRDRSGADATEWDRTTPLYHPEQAYPYKYLKVTEAAIGPAPQPDKPADDAPSAQEGQTSS